MPTYLQDYKQNRIYLNERGTFYVSDNGHSGKPCPQAGLSADTFDGLKKAIDKARKTKHERIECIVGKWSGDFKLGVITSVNGATARVTTDKSKGELVYDYKDKLYPVTAHNVALFDEIDIRQIAIRELESEIFELKQKMISFEVAERSIRKNKRSVSSPNSEDDTD